jgi:hypothetical protein
LSYSTDDTGKISFDLKGQSYSYNAIAFQSDVFSKVSQIQAPVFSGLVLDDKGVISFNVKAGLDASALKYSNQFKNEVVAPVSVPVATTSPTSLQKSTTTAPTTTPARTSGTASTTTVRVGT